jgi:hypothetical protein
MVFLESGLARSYNVIQRKTYVKKEHGLRGKSPTSCVIIIGRNKGYDQRD